MVGNFLSEQQICGSLSIHFVVRTNWAHPPSASGHWGRQMNAGERRLNYSSFPSFDNGSVLL